MRWPAFSAAIRSRRALAYRECAAAGMTQAEAARAMGVDASSVKDYALRHGLSFRNGLETAARAKHARMAKKATFPARPIKIVGDLAYITLTRGYTAVIDAVDAPLVSEFNWSIKQYAGRCYAARSGGRDEHGKMRSPISLHRTIMNFPDGKSVDHVNGDGLDNRRANLRAVTHQQNMMNRGAQKNNASGLKGVTWNRRLFKWQAGIKVDGKKHYLGSFDTAELAHDAYKSACKELHGEFGRAE